MNDKSLTKRQKYWLSHVQAYQQQNLSVKEYAEQEGLELRALYQAKSQLVKAEILSGKKNRSFKRSRSKPCRLTASLHYPMAFDWSGRPTAMFIH